MKLRTAMVALAASLSFVGTADAQMVADVHFLQGNFGAMVSGTITGDAYYDYRMGASGGQELFAELTMTDTDGHGSIYFNILPPGSEGVAIYNGSIDGNAARITLPEDGDYTIRVYLMGNDRDAGKTVGYNLDLSIQ